MINWGGRPSSYRLAPVTYRCNGTGKSRFGRFVETSNQSLQVHRVGAQKLLQIPENTAPATIDNAEQTFKTSRYSGLDEITGYHSDYEHLLRLVFAKEVQRDAEFIKAYRAGARPEDPPTSLGDRIVAVWNQVLPHRAVKFEDGRVVVSIDGTSYSGGQMSDGERVALYLMGQVLLAPPSALIIIDEPELHLHPAIRDTMWSALEAERTDSVFVYLTHDVDFAAARPASLTIWLRDYRGNNRWLWEEVQPVEGLPEALLNTVLGSRRKVLFVEGEAGSLDVLLYSAAFPERYVHPAGSCDRVIALTRSLRGADYLHHLDAQGLVDRDRRESYEVDQLLSSHICVLDVAEVENLLLLPDVVKAIARKLALDQEDCVRQVQDLVLRRLVAQETRQIAEHVSYRAEAAVRRAFGAPDRSLEGLKSAVEQIPNTVDVDALWAECSATFTAAKADYRAALQVYNEKGLVRQAANELFGLKPSAGEDGLTALVRRLVRHGEADEILTAVRAAVLGDPRPDGSIPVTSASAAPAAVAVAAPDPRLPTVAP